MNLRSCFRKRSLNPAEKLQAEGQGQPPRFASRKAIGKTLQYENAKNAKNAKASGPMEKFAGTLNYCWYRGYVNVIAIL